MLAEFLRTVKKKDGNAGVLKGGSAKCLLLLWFGLWINFSRSHEKS